jgi:hypothetical protein
MKSTEIIPEAVLDEYSVTDKGIIDHLTSKGYKLLGSGVDQTAFLEPDGTVLKIFGTQLDTSIPKEKNQKPTFSNDHKMFFVWAKYCNSHASNPFLPKFSGFESFYWNDRVYLQIRQERLWKLSRDTADMMEELGYKAMDGVSFKTAYEEVGDFWPEQMIKLEDEVGMQGLKLLYQTLKKLNQIAVQNGWTNDLHRGNFMSRGKNNFPVITDPWVF